MVGVGQCSITATQAGNASYAAATPVTQLFTVLGLPDLTVSKQHVGNFSQGQNGAVYTIVASNSGNGATNGSAVTVTDTLPAGLTASAMSGTGWTCALTPTVTCSRSDVLTNGRSYPAITLTVNVDPAAAATVNNQVAVSGGGETNVSNDGASDSTVINPIVIVTSKLSSTQNGFARNRATGLWVSTMTVTNTDPTSVNGPIQVVLTNLTPGVTMVNNTGTRNGSPYITVTPGALGSGKSVSVQIQFSNPSNGFIGFTPVAASGVF